MSKQQVITFPIFIHDIYFYHFSLESQFIFEDMKSAFALCKKYSKYNSRVKIFANRNDAENFIQEQRNNLINNEDNNMLIEQVSKTVNNDAEKLPYSDVPTSELTKLYNLVEKGAEIEFERLVWSNPRYLISSGDSPTIVKVNFSLVYFTHLKLNQTISFFIDFSSL